MTDVVSTLTMRVYAECNRGGCANGVEDARTAWTLAHRAFADRSLPIAMAHLALGFSEWKTGVKDGPDAEMRAGDRDHESAHADGTSLCSGRTGAIWRLSEVG